MSLRVHPDVVAWMDEHRADIIRRTGAPVAASRVYLLRLVVERGLVALGVRGVE